MEQILQVLEKATVFWKALPWGIYQRRKNILPMPTGTDVPQLVWLDSASSSMVHEFPHGRRMIEEADKSEVSETNEKSFYPSKMPRILHLSSLAAPETSNMSRSETHLFVCLRSISYSEAASYSIWSLRLADLLNESLPPPVKPSLVSGWVSSYECHGRGFLNIGNRLYVFGGEKPWIDFCGSFTFSSRDASPNLFCADIVKNPNPIFSSVPTLSRLSPLKGMHSGKADPIAVEIGGKLYVLAGQPYMNRVPYPDFEVYDPHANSWFPLDSPLLVDRSSEYFAGRTACQPSYVAIGNKFCVSSVHASFAYDTVERQWEACKLFDGFNGEGWRRRFTNPDKLECGPPFDFEGKAIVYDGDILLCPGKMPFLVVAYLMDSGRIVRRQELLPCDIRGCYEIRLVDLGGGYFCCMSNMQSVDIDDPDFFYYVFKVSKVADKAKGTTKISEVGEVVKDGSRCDFLACEGLKQWKGRMNMRQACEPVFSFTI